jgi:alkanesulfonate monooxygenase SsuD/methylene tetrahydromethanopterin reductase-like flavin-dependent oxidoreductase (luciferase family)
MAGVNVIASESDDDAQRQFEFVRRWRIARFLARGQELSEHQVDELVASPQGQQVAQMMHYSAVGTADEVASYVREFAHHANVDEVITAHSSATIDERLRSVDLLADANDPVVV